MAMHKPEVISVDHILVLADQLSPDQQEELCYKLNRKVRCITIEGPIPAPANEKLDEIRKSAQAALQKAGVTVDELLEEVERVKEERFAKEHPDLTEAHEVLWAEAGERATDSGA